MLIIGNQYVGLVKVKFLLCSILLQFCYKRRVGGGAGLNLLELSFRAYLRVILL